MMRNPFVRVMAIAWLTCALGLAPSWAAAPAAAESRGEFVGAVETTYPDWFKLSFLDLAEDVAEAKAADKRLVLFFYQDGCPYCHALVTRNLAQKDIEALLRSRFDVLTLNIWGDREVTAVDGTRFTEKTFAASLGVQYTPTLVFYDEAGATVLRLNGYVPPQKMRVALDFVAGRHEATTSYREFAAARQPPADSGRLHPEPFFESGPVNLAAKRTLRAVFFEQKDCPDCDTLHREVLPDPAIRALLAKFHAVQLDMWSRDAVVTPAGKRTTARDWAQQLDVRYAPTIVLFDGEGNEVIRSEAEFKVFHTRGILDYVASGAWRHEPSFQRFLSERAEALRAAGHTVDIWRQAR